MNEATREPVSNCTGWIVNGLSVIEGERSEGNDMCKGERLHYSKTHSQGDDDLGWKPVLSWWHQALTRWWDCSQNWHPFCSWNSRNSLVQFIQHPHPSIHNTYIERALQVSLLLFHAGFSSPNLALLECWFLYLWIKYFPASVGQGAAFPDTVGWPASLPWPSSSLPPLLAGPVHGKYESDCPTCFPTG